jgi:hypothetical protein
MQPLAAESRDEDMRNLEGGYRTRSNSKSILTWALETASSRDEAQRRKERVRSVGRSGRLGLIVKRQF